MEEPERVRKGKLIGVSFSLAGLLLARVWQDVDQVTTALAAYRLGPGAARSVEAVALAGVSIFTGLFMLLIAATNRARSQALRRAGLRALAVAGGFAVGSLVVLAGEKASEYILDNGWVREHAKVWTAILWGSRAVRWALIPGAVVAGALWCPKRAWAALQVIATMMIPFATWRTGHAFYHLVRPRGSALFTTEPLQAKLRAKPPWIVWIVFDEMDQCAAFEDPANSGLVPALHAFSDTAFYATRAYEPSDNTAKSIPAYLTGRLAVEERWGREGLRLRFAGSKQYVTWWRQRTILEEATAAGHAIAVLGHFHPYCEIFGELTSACAVFPACASADLKAWVATPDGRSFWRTAQLELVRLLPLPPSETGYNGMRVRYGDWVLHQQGIEIQSRCLGEVTKTVLSWLRDSVATFYFLHVPVPHPPSIAFCQELPCDHKVPLGYNGNLHWSDHLFEAIRQELLRQGRWANTTVLVTSDHGTRAFWEESLELTPSLERAIRRRREPTVPLLIKLAGQREGFQYDRPFNAVLLHGILRGILEGRIGGPQDVADYIDARRERVPLVPRKSVTE